MTLSTLLLLAGIFLVHPGGGFGAIGYALALPLIFMFAVPALLVLIGISAVIFYIFQKMKKT